MKNDHEIPLDEMLADAATELRGSGMLALAHAVDIARMKLGGHVAEESETQLKLLPLPLAGFCGAV